MSTYRTFPEGAHAFNNPETARGKQDLVVIYHGFRGSPSTMSKVKDAIQSSDRYKTARPRFHVPQLPFGLLSTKNPHRIIADQMVGIEDELREMKNDGLECDNVVLVGHSAGAVFLRKLYVVACGENGDAPFEKDLQDYLKAETKLNWKDLSIARDWASQVERVVLLAGLNRGAWPAFSLNRLFAFWMAFWIWFGRALCIPHVMLHLVRGDPFLSHLRLQWLAMLKQGKKGGKVGAATIVQLLGSIDDYASPDDNIDLATGEDFVYLDVPFSGHKSVLEMGTSNEEEIGRRHVLQDAVVFSADVLKKDMNVLPSDEEIVKDETVTDVVFVIHGIRDRGFWTRKIARKVIKDGRNQVPKKIVRSVTASYGYFPILSFLSPRRRREKVEWFVDNYIEARVKYPNATRFLCLGHSQGTYLVAKAILDYPAIRFDRIVFAGSVVMRRYKWEDIIRRDQVLEGSVFNIVATNDWPVALGSKFIRKLHLRPGLLGSAGHDGFTSALVQQLPDETPYVFGRHGAGTQEKLWDATSKFLLNETDTLLPPSDILKRRKFWLVQLLSMFPLPIAWIVPVLPGAAFGGCVYTFTEALGPDASIVMG